MTYWTDEGLLNDKSLPNWNENRFLITATYYILSGRKSILFEANCYALLKDKNDFDSQKLSHDTITGIVCYAMKYNKDLLKLVSIVSKDRLHPRDIIFYLWCKYPLMGIWFMPLHFLISLISMLRVYKHRPHGTFIATDTKILLHLKVMTCFLPLHKLMADYLIKRNKELGSWDECFATYYQDEDHPIRKIVSN